MKLLIAFAAAAAGSLVGCGPIDGAERSDTPGVVRQELTPCLSICYANCGTNIDCRDNCRMQCAPCDNTNCENLCSLSPDSPECQECQAQCIWPEP
jgi:hypothetical protein